MKVGGNAYVSYEKSDNLFQRLVFVKLQKNNCNVFEKVCNTITKKRHIVDSQFHALWVEWSLCT